MGILADRGEGMCGGGEGGEGGWPSCLPAGEKRPSTMNGGRGARGHVCRHLKRTCEALLGFLLDPTS